jgi:calcium-dependent protein kinase
LFSPTGLAKLFKSIDADSSGTITVEELKKALQDWGHRIHDVSGRLCG